MKIWLLIGLIALAVSMDAVGQPEEADRIRETVLDYVSSRYEGRPDLMRTVLHPDAVRQVAGSNVEGTTFVIREDFEKIVAGTRRPYSREKGEQPQIQILDITGHAATVKVTTGGIVDHLYLAKTRQLIQPAEDGFQPPIIEQSWKILHILHVVNR